MPFKIQQSAAEKYKQVTLAEYTEEAGVTEIIVPEEVRILKSACFFGCEKIISVILPDGIEKIPAVLIDSGREEQSSVL